MRAQANIFLALDGECLAADMESLLGWAGFDVETFSDMPDVMNMIAQAAPDLVILEVPQNDLKVRVLLSQLRQGGINVPVILIGSGGPLERALALDEGADDYLTKPADPTELVARIRAVLRRSRVSRSKLETAHRLCCDQLVIDRVSRRARLDAQELILTPKAFALLEYLMTHPDQLITRDRLLDSVWGWNYPAGIRAVDTRIFELRKALGDRRAQPRYIETVSGQGYRFIGQVNTLT